MRKVPVKVRTNEGRLAWALAEPTEMQRACEHARPNFDESVQAHQCLDCEMWIADGGPDGKPK